MNRLGLRRDGHDRFIIFGSGRASQHFQIPLAHRDLPFHHHFVLLLVDPQIVVGREIDEVRIGFGIGRRSGIGRGRIRRGVAAVDRPN